MSNTEVTFSASPANARSESSIAINPVNPQQIIDGSKKFTNPATYAFTLATSWSHDGGISWHESAPLPLLADWTSISDPAICWDNAGNAYLLALPLTNPNLTTVGIAVYKSTDHGLSWGTPNLIHASTGDDKQWIAADKSNGHIYGVWDDGAQMRFARSSDNGNTWKGKGAEAVGSILATDSFAPEINVADNGDIYVFYLASSSIKFVKS